MKRIISLLLLLFLMISVSCPAMAQNTVEIDEETIYMHNVLKNLGFISYDCNATVYGETVTRAEALDVIVRVFSCYNNETKALDPAQTYFFDINADSKYADSVNYAAGLGIVSGNGVMFMPDRVITLSEAVTFIMRAAGYKVYAEVNGGYPSGYIKSARMANLLDESVEQNGDTLTREAFTRLLYNGICMNIMDQTVFGETNKFENNGKTVLEHFHDIYVSSGRVNATFISSIDGKNPTDDTKIRVGEDEYLLETSGIGVDLLGYYADVYYTKTDSSSVKVLKYIDKQPDCDEIIISADDIRGFDNLTYTYGDNSKKEKISSKHNLIVNGKKLTDYTEKDFVPANGYIVLVGNRGVYDTVVINTFVNIHLQRLIVGGDDKLTLTQKESLRRFQLDLYDNDLIVEVYKDNRKIDIKPFSYTIKGVEYETTTFEEIPEGSVASVFADEYEKLNGWIIPAKTAKLVRIYVQTPKTYGVCTEIFDDGITIDGVDYTVAKDNLLSELKPNDAGYFVEDFDGKIFARYDASYTKEISYAYLINADLGSGLNKKLKLKLMTENGKIDIYDVAENMKLNGETKKSHEAVYNALGDSAKLLDSTYTISQPVKVDFNDDGLVNEIYTVSLIDTEESLKRNGERRYLTSRSDNGGMLYSSGAAELLKPKRYFVVPKTETFEDEQYHVYTSWTPNYASKLVDVFDVTEHRVPELVVSYEDERRTSLNRDMVMVNRIIRSLNDEGNEVTEVEGYDGFGKVYYYSEDLDLFDGVKEGDIIRMYGHGEEINSWEYVMKLDAALNHDFSSSQGIRSSGMYEIYSVKGNEMVLQHDELLEESHFGQRKTQMGIRWNNDPASFYNGAVYYDSQKITGKVSSVGITSGVPDSVKTVRNVGNADSTKAYIIVGNGMIYFIALYN